MREELHNHLIVCGLGHVGYRVIEMLQELCEPFTVIARDIRPEWRSSVEALAARLVDGDARSESCLREAGIATARAILIVTNDDLINIEIALDAQRLNPEIAVIVRVFDRYLADRMNRDTGVRHVLSPALLTAPVFVAAALGEEMLRTFTVGNSHFHILRLSFSPDMPGIGETLAQFCAHRELIPLAIRQRRDTDGESVLEAEGACSECAPAALSAHILMPGDEIVVAASGPVTERLRREGCCALQTAASPSFAHRLLALLRRPLYPMRALRRAWRRAPRILRWAFVALHILFAISVVVFHNELPGEPTWVDAFYFVVTMMTTVGFGDFNLRHGPWWLKIYGCGVMVGGAALVAIVYGLISDYILTARMEQALGRRQTSLTNHVVVIGLGDVGTRVVEELHRIGEPVVAIERDADHEAVPDLQDRIQVIVGDSMRESILRQANIPHARALIVTTTNDTDSLRIAHQAEMINPALRSVVRLYDSSLARKLGASLHIDRTVNAGATAAATFVATALQPQVEQGFRLGRRLLMLRWLLPKDVRAAGLVGKTGAEIQAQGYTPALKRTKEQTLPLKPSDIIGTEDALLVLEEYYPETRRCAAPSVMEYTDAASL